MAVEKETQLEAFLDSLKGDSNPNYSEIINGTMESLWGDVNLENLIASVMSDNATAYINYDASALEMGTGRLMFNANAIDETGVAFNGIGNSGDRVDNWICLAIKYLRNGELDYIRLLASNNVRLLTTYASLINTQLVIIHHPLPEN